MPMTDEATAAVKTTDKQIVPMRGLEAPILYVDGSTNMGCNNQVVSLTLVTAVYLPQSDGQVTTEWVVSAHLRMSIVAAMSVRDAINKALLIAMPSEGSEAH
jgi:hypothetical protein